MTPDDITRTIRVLRALRDEMLQTSESVCEIERLEGQVAAERKRAQHWQDKTAEIEILRGREADEAQRLRGVISAQRDQLARVQEEHSRQAAAWSEERRELKRRIVASNFGA